MFRLDTLSWGNCKGRVTPVPKHHITKTYLGVALNIQSFSTLDFFLIRIVGGGVQTGSTRHVGHFWPIVPALGDCEDGEFGAI
jgi:hypothetical protein